jgi:hypothetical protein
MQNKSNHDDRYRIRRERIALKFDELCAKHNQLADDDPERDQLLDQMWALNLAYNVED